MTPCAVSRDLATYMRTLDRAEARDRAVERLLETLTVTAEQSGDGWLYLVQDDCDTVADSLPVYATAAIAKQAGCAAADEWAANKIDNPNHATWETPCEL